MAQLRQDYARFAEMGVKLVVIGPEGPQAFKNYWRLQNLPFIGLPDPSFKVLKLFGQEINLFKLGRMPAQVIIDMEGIVRYAHYGNSMSDIPDNESLMEIITAISREFHEYQAVETV
jgi:peroxiredoxin Q/BCP